jgi:hypothetical protein
MQSIKIHGFSMIGSKQQVNKDLSNVFIIGSPRSGTSVLGWALAQHPALWTSAETDILLYMFQKPWFREQYETAVAKPEKRNWLIKHEVSYEEFAASIGKGLNAMFQSRAQNRIFVDSTPAYTSIAADLMVFFPNAKFIHIIRDGKDVVNSMLKSGFAEAFATDFKHACEFWVFYVQKGLEAKQAFPQRVHEIRNENLVSDPEKEFAKAYEFLGLEDCQESSAFIRTKRINSSYLNVEKSDIKKAKDPALMPKQPWKSWTSQERNIFVEVAGKTMTQLGYELNFE